MKIIGVVPARMASSRFPGKPMHPILGKPMIEHVFRRAQLFKEWNGLFLATCDQEIEEYGKEQRWPVIMTSNKHIRCLDRVAEAVENCGSILSPEDLVVCIQGDEPLLHPDMIHAAIKPVIENLDVNCTVLAMCIQDEDQFYNPNTVKIIHDIKGDVLYTSRSPVPYTKTFSPTMNVRRIYGILAFRWKFLKLFNSLPESPLELVESCDSNRIIDNGLKQRIAPYPYRPSFSVDSPSDIQLVEAALKTDVLWGAY